MFQPLKKARSRAYLAMTRSPPSFAKMSLHVYLTEQLSMRVSLRRAYATPHAFKRVVCKKSQKTHGKACGFS